ncbi:hypothetical protein EW146_g6100 [Bondarzewia mesenterica]|uniref:Uncharacterized protein n=1 Tax=Bondarzewia mesenterica TaxID=1095465 RepID=A0A4S4LQJ8_9AGAM|nr:hypothetical protein EW146_g6100 [Bondarzewia mesenterica]
MTRTVYFAVFNSILFPAHWGLWIPTVEKPELGKMIQVNGDPLSGFQHDFERNCNIKDTKRTHILFVLAEIEDRFVLDLPPNVDNPQEPAAIDEIEQKAIAIPPPTKSLRSSADAVGSFSQISFLYRLLIALEQAMKKVDIKNCQTWLCELVDALVADHIFPKSAIQVMKDAPRN